MRVEGKALNLFVTLLANKKQDLNQRITAFLEQNAKLYTKEQWLFIFRDGWTWSDEHQDYYRLKQDGGYEWASESQAAASSSSSEWTWSEEHQDYFRYKEDGTHEWASEASSSKKKKQK
jgi:hypothetical protein